MFFQQQNVFGFSVLRLAPIFLIMCVPVVFDLKRQMNRIKKILKNSHHEHCFFINIFCSIPKFILTALFTIAGAPLERVPAILPPYGGDWDFSLCNLSEWAAQSQPIGEGSRSTFSSLGISVRSSSLFCCIHPIGFAERGIRTVHVTVKIVVGVHCPFPIPTEKNAYQVPHSSPLL